MRPLRIAFFNRAFYPEESATGQLLTELALGLARNHGWEVSVVTGPAPRPADTAARPTARRTRLVSVETWEGITVLRARGTTFSKVKFAGRACNYITYFTSACVAGLRLRRPDVVIALTDPPIIGLAALLAARRFSCPCAISFRDIFPEVGRLLADFRSPFVDGMLQRINRFLVRRADCVIALGEAMKIRLVEGKGADPSKVVILPDWADREAIVPVEKRNPFSIRNGLADRFVVMHSGNLGLSQNLEMLLEAARRLSDLHDLVVVFMGQGVRKAALQEAAQRMALRNVRFLPFQPKEALSEAFSSADCFVISLAPGLSGSIMPSKLYGILAAGRPFVSSVDEGCDVVRIARKYGCGLPAHAGDAGDLAEKIRALYQDRDLATRMGQKAREASRDFDARVGVQGYDRVCRALIQKKEGD